MTISLGLAIVIFLGALVAGWLAIDIYGMGKRSQFLEFKVAYYLLSAFTIIGYIALCFFFISWEV